MADAKEAKHATAEDIEKNKTMAILAYFIFFLPLLTDSKNSTFAKFHANQSLMLVIASFVGWTAATVLTVVLIGFLLMPIVAIGVLVLWIMGIMAASSGEMKRLPLIGNFDLIK